ncbi:hypothetical protein LIER_38552 [Lithospermum erythrorhizon]|uniref:DNA helicase Pif1-like 2B domain-containing protein n=1 Tax=Lithospermum erythrorhizon TaxID=34254 RepID=A0AAV3Q1N3_LITER
MRARNDPGFINFLMRIGNGTERANEKDEIEISNPMLIPYTTLEQSIEDLITYIKLINRIPGQEVVYISDDRAKHLIDEGDYVDYLNNLEPKGLPQHRLVLKKNCPVILLRNINPVEGQFKGNHVWIPRIPLEPSPSDNKYLIPFVRRQFPLRLCFAMTINKEQGQTLDCVGLYLRYPVFSHGQLYVALSRAKTGENVKVLIISPILTDLGTKYTTNVVYNEVLIKASLN